ncbi:S24/S26 family peptidase [Rhodococcus sp. IEGM 1330]|uniref:S24/S26 family peptidase n=1 Tax=Rhodococcus sp. IEGM 1330 TaxID=3082225 RepID=UPI00295523DE|nr:S24/S26 family peptidase [Rhodococcus sp. IEGM 1330]MDV8024341.1 S24/S26 family peptidase [Rhodococcus sp. IEGM 1330]
MAPAIDTGALAISKETAATEVRVGDIVNVTNAAGSRITHRVVEIGAVGTDSAQLFLRGDANAERDSESYIVSEVGRVVASVPKLGYAVSWLSGPVAVFAGGVLVGVLLMVAWSPGRGRTITAEPEGGEQDRPRGRHSRTPLTMMIAVATLSAVGLSSTHVPTTLAQLGDSAVATSGEFRTLLLRPASFNCTNVFLVGARLSWPNVNTAYSYQLDFTPAATGVTNPIILGPSAAATRTYDVGSLFTTAMIGDRTFTLRARLGDFRSASAGTWTVNFLTGAITTCISSTPAPASAPAGAAARSAPQALAPSTPSTVLSTTAPPPTTTAPTGTTESVVPTTTVPPTTTTIPPATTTTTVPMPPPTTTTTTPAPAALSAPVTSPSGASTARVVDIDGAATLQIVDASGAIQYSAPASSSEAYGYGVNWSAGDQLWLLGPDQLARLDGTGGSWSRTVIDPADTDQIPADILALLQ